MCNSSSKIYKFCTCATEHDTVLEDYTWTLTRFLETKQTLIRGKIVIPKDDLGNGIHIDSILEQLNSLSCFDFDYSPEEKDCFKIYTPHATERTRYLSVIYRNGLWEKGANPAFASRTEKIAEGKITVINNPNL